MKIEIVVKKEVKCLVAELSMTFNIIGLHKKI